MKDNTGIWHWTASKIPERELTNSNVKCASLRRRVNTPEVRQTFVSHAKVGSSAERAHHRARRRVLRVVTLEWELQLVKIALVELTLLKELQFA